MYQADILDILAIILLVLTAFLPPIQVGFLRAMFLTTYNTQLTNIFILLLYVFSVACCHPFLIMPWSVLRFLSLYVIQLIVSCCWYVVCYTWLKTLPWGSPLVQVGETSAKIIK